MGMMDERKFRILRAIIDDYILTAVPVGSRTISKKYETGLSSATIRNEMSDLEELGYLAQPHVSAGRIPSAKAYRLYVDQLLQSGQIASPDPEALKAHFSGRVQKMEDVVNHAAQVLSSLTNYTAIVTPPKGREPHIRNLQLVPVTSTSALVVIVTDIGVVKDAVIRVDEGLDADALYAISRMLTEKLSGLTFHEATQLLCRAETSQPSLIQGIAAMTAQSDKPAIAVGGTSNIFNYPEYSDVEKAKSFLSLLETRDKLAQLMETGGQMAFTVRIGPETGLPEMSDCSIVTATYVTGNHQTGTIGVIGPTRMHYSRVLSILSSMGQQLTELLGSDD